ncbi:MAG: hypothetical protein ACLQGV_08440, partial [Bryobacteraceae bacterium]
ADTGTLLSWQLEDESGNWQPYMAVTTGASASLVNAPGAGQFAMVTPVLQAQDGSFVGAALDANYNPLSMIGFDAGGNLLWSVAGNWQPQIATADGGLIAVDQNTGAAVAFDQNGNAKWQLASLPAQSWPGNQYQSLGSLESVVEPLVFEDGASFWPTAGGNPSGNGTAIVQCPCLLQSAGEADTPGTPQTPTSRSARGYHAEDAGDQKRYLVMAGDPGHNFGPGHDHNVGQLFSLAAETQLLNLTQSGNNVVVSQRVSSFADFNAALTANGWIDGDVTYFGHAGLDVHRNPALFPGQEFGDANNVTVLNVGQLSNAQLDPNVTITLNACHAGYGGRRSIAQLIANQLGRRVLAYPVDMYFSSDPTPRAYRKGMVAPSGVPTYMVPNGDGVLPLRFPLQ